MCESCNSQVQEITCKMVEAECTQHIGTEKQIYLLFSYKTEQEIEDSLAHYTALLISG